MTETELKQIEARAEQATPGPWLTTIDGIMFSIEHDDGTRDTEFTPGVRDEYGDHVLTGAGAEAQPNAVFITHSRQDVPALCRALREAWEVLAEWDEYRAYLLIHGFEHLPKWLPTVDALPEDGKR